MKLLVLKKGDKGPEVAQLQRAMNKRARSRGIASVQVDGELGPVTWDTWEELYVALGGQPGTFSGGRLRALRRYQFIRFPGTRGALPRARAKAWQKARRASSGALERAWKWAGEQVGTKEQPAGSNTGPKIRDWLRGVGLLFGAPWCGAYAWAVAKQYGVDLDDRVRYCPYIEADAKASVRGFERWTTSAAEAQRALDAGHLVLTVFDFGGSIAAHVGVLRQVLANGQVRNYEGNTSSGSSGSQDNGGMVAIRDRSMSAVRGFAVVRKPKG